MSPDTQKSGPDTQKSSPDAQEPHRHRAHAPHRPHPLSGTPWAGLRVGLLGGSFNPAHDGHRAISVFALRALRLDQVWWLVSPQNPLKGRNDMAPLAQRLATADAVASHPRIVVSDIESRLETQYTAHTLRELRSRYPRTRFIWLIGADNLAQMPRWYRWRQIFMTIPVATFNRAPYSLRALAGCAAHRFSKDRVGASRAGRLAAMKPPAWVFLQNPRHPASATAIRRNRSDAATDPTYLY